MEITQKEQLKQSLLKMVDKMKRHRITDGHPFTEELLRGRDNHTDESAEDMTLMMIGTDTRRSLHQLTAPANIPHLEEDKMGQAPEPEDENVIEVVGDEPAEEHPEPEVEDMIEVVEDEPEEEPPEIHTTRKEVKKMMLNTLSPTSKVFTAHEPQRTTLYLRHVNDYKGDMLIMTYKENGFIKDSKQYTMYSLHEAAFREEQDAKTFMGDLMIGNTYKEDKLAVTFEKDNVLQMIDKAAYREDKDAKTFKGNLMIGDTYKEDVLAVTFEDLLFDF